MGAWCEASTDFDLLVELIAHALADEETSTIQVAHHQSAARQKCKLLADFGQMHLAWAQHLLDNREFVKMEGRSELCSGQNEAAYDSDEEERDLYQQDLHMNATMLGATATGARPTDRGGESHPAQPNTPSPLVHGSVRYIANPPGGARIR